MSVASQPKEDTTITIMDNNSRSRSLFDPDFDNSGLGVNLMIKKNMLFTSEDSNSQLGKRSRAQLNSDSRKTENETKEEIILNEESFEPPKAKQRTNVTGEWKATKVPLVVTSKNNSAIDDVDFSRFLNQKSTQNSTKSSFNFNTNFLCKSTHKAWGTAAMNDCNVILPAVNNQQKPETKTSKSLSLEAQGFVTLGNTAKKVISRRSSRRKKRTVVNDKREDSTDIDIIHEIQSSVVNIPLPVLPLISLPKVPPPPSLSSVFLPLTKGLDATLVKKFYQPPKESAFDKIKEKEELLQKNRKQIFISKMDEINNFLSVTKSEMSNVDIVSNCSTRTISSRTSIDSISSKDLLKSHHRKKHRMKPMNIVLNTSIMENIVPILKRKEDECFVDNAPMFLNAEQWLKKKAAERQRMIKTGDIISETVVKEQKEIEEEESMDSDVDMNVNSVVAIADVIHDDRKEDKSLDIWNIKPIQVEKKGNWAQKLFPEYIEANLKQKKIEQNIEVKKRMQEHLHDIQVEKILPKPDMNFLSSKCTPVWRRSADISISSFSQRMSPKKEQKRSGPQLHFHSPNVNTNEKIWKKKNSRCWMKSSSSNTNPWRNVQTPDPIDLQLNRNLSREFSAESEDVYAYSRSGSLTASESVSSVCSVSQAAMDWRLKQISYGKNTRGYQIYIREHPCKEFNYRRDRYLPMTPNANDMIGKKRWVGKLRKWRKELHFFDNKYENECEIRSSVILKESKEENVSLVKENVVVNCESVVNVKQ